MPISKTTEKHDEKYWLEFYKRLKNIIVNEISEDIKQLFKTDKIEIERAESPQGNIVKYIIECLQNSDILISILTDKNVNVFYELGIRHAIRNNTIMLNQKDQNIPFDLTNYGVGLYRENVRYKDIQKELLKRFKLIALNKNKSDNPVSEFLKRKEISEKPISIKKHRIIDYEKIFDIQELTANLKKYVQLVVDFKINSLGKNVGINYLKYQKYLFHQKENGIINHLPYIISPRNRIKTEPYIEYNSKVSYYNVSNWHVLDKLYFYENKITYSSIELADDNEFISLTTYIPFLSITYILFLLKELHTNEDLNCDIDISIRILHNCPVKISKVDSPWKNEFYKLESGLLDIYNLGENNSIETKIKSFLRNDIYDFFSLILTLFSSSNTTSIHPYMTINELDFNNKFNDIFKSSRDYIKGIM